MIFCLSACSSNSKNAEASLTDSFNEFLASKSSNSSYNGVFETNNLELNLVRVEKENRERRYRIVVSSVSYNEQCFDTSLEMLKSEMKNFAELFISFAKKQKMDNDYYLYTSFAIVTDVDFVYDYEEDKLYYPERYERLVEMFNKFGSVSESKVAETEYGKNWLVENKFGKIKHHEYESNHRYIHDQPHVYIDENGKFSSYGSFDEYI